MLETGNNIQNKVISIRISTGGFSFMVDDKTKNIKFDKEDSEYNRIKAICLCDPILQQDFRRINIYFSSKHSCLLPKIDVNNAGTIVRNSFSDLKESDSYSYLTNQLLGYDIIDCFAIPTHLKSFLVTTFPGCQINHSDTIFAAQALRHSRIGGNKQVWANIEDNDLTIAYCINGKMIFFNHFTLRNHTDIIYYIGAVYEQFQLSQKDDFLMICGSIANIDEFKERIQNCQHKESIYAYN